MSCALVTGVQTCALPIGDHRFCECFTIDPFTKTLVGLLSHGNLPHVGAEKRGYIMPPSTRRSNARLSHRGFPVRQGSLRLKAAPFPRYHCRLCRRSEERRVGNAWVSTWSFQW